MSNKKKILESKEIIYSLAQLATKKIYENSNPISNIHANNKIITDYDLTYPNQRNKVNKKHKQIVDVKEDQIKMLKGEIKNKWEIISKQMG